MACGGCKQLRVQLGHAVTATTDPVRAELIRRIKDPAERAKFERFYSLMDKRLTKLGPNAGTFPIMDATRACWKRVFGMEWPKRRVA